MYDLAALGVAAVCLAFCFAFLYVMEKVWCRCRGPTGSAWSSRSSCLRISCTRSSAGSGS